MRGALAPGFYCHRLGATGFAGGPQRVAGAHVTRAEARFPDVRGVAQDVLVEGVAGPGDEQPVLIGIFRFDDGRFAEMWGVSAGFPAAASPEELLG